MTCWPPFSRVKEQGIGAILALYAYLRGRYNAVRLQTVIDATMCAIIAQFIRDLLDFAGSSSNLAEYNERV